MKQVRTVAILAALILGAAAASAEVPPIIDTIKSPLFNTLFGERMAALGDQNGDGFDDFVVTDPPKRVRMYYGGNSITGPVFTVDSAAFYLDAPGDLNGDGFLDFTTSIRYGFEYVRTGVFYGGSLLDAIPELLIGVDSFPAPYGKNFLANGLRSPGSKDLIPSDTYEPFGGNALTLQFTNFLEPVDSVPDFQLVITPPETGLFYQLLSVTVGDFNGDGADDLCTGIAYDPQHSRNGLLQFYWGGTGFDTIADLVIRRPGPNSIYSVYFGSVLANVGDVNGDSYDDILASCGNSLDTSRLLYLGGPNIDTIPDLEILNEAEYHIGVGDINNDNFDDFMMSSTSPFVLSTVWIFYGSASPDNIPDIRINHTELPDADQYFGLGMAGLGDVNNDGVNDYGVSYYDYNLHGGVIVFAGQYSTGADDEEPSNIPTTVTLQQNYPNPFNPSTTIEFALPTAGSTTLVIYNSTGQVVRNLLNKQLPAGTHRIEWDGKDFSGRELASGLYLYELEGSHFRESRKMTLIR